jgi:ubiquinone/menaquinone biosynthesis C-methylase UbiE
VEAEAIVTQKIVGGSVSFDNAADVYDATRALEPHIVAKQTEALLGILGERGIERLLEVGIGTGRITRPLMERGVRVSGIDISARMMARLRDQLGAAHLTPDLLLGDATRLPLRDESFRAVLMVHVLHLVSDWRATITEMRRVLTPDSVFLHDVTQYPEPNPWRKVWDRRKELFAKHGITTRPRPEPEQIIEALRAAGGSQRTIVYAEDEERDTLQKIVDNLRDRVDSSTWEIPSDIHGAFVADFEAWCRQEYGDLQREYVVRMQYTLEVWTFGR